jgi:hypothetical protein
VFCGEQLLVAYLRPSKIAGAQSTPGRCALIQRLRQAWPTVHLILRAVSGFCRHRMFAGCERGGVGYLVGPAQNARLNALTQRH